MKSILAILCAFPALAGILVGADWPQFMGPDRSGVVSGSLPDQLPVAGPPVVWERELGSGFAGPVIADGKTILFHRKGDEVVVEACDASAGVMLWQFTYLTDYVDSFGFDNGPRGTPAVADGRVFVHGAEGMLHAIDLESGKLLWKVDTVADFKSGQGFFGRACSPLVVKDRVIITPGGSKDGKPAGMVAFDVKDGHVVWQSVEDEAGYSSPITVPGSPDRVMCWMRNKLWLVDAASGEMVASLPLRSSMDASVNAAQPVACGEDRYLISAGYGVGANMVQLPGLELLWQKQDLFDSHYSTGVLHEGHLYGFEGRQEQGQTLRCIDVEKGTVDWDGEAVPGGTIISVGDKLLAVTEQGELWLIRATPEKCDILSTAQILRSGHRSFPAYANGILYARDGRKVVAVKVVGD
ncbi:MAG: PQQ-binding-like beta-propeller repeat protein [Verrucomicrobiales bacterium]|nr:PQQ-binding-like beta-propeller repeat protein [Verrucomicrobiales bacterium]MCP5557338.1 PQQ-binding-like beta-propeller repeat protein [Verrucomicrobiaceae bacterium]